LEHFSLSRLIFKHLGILFLPIVSILYFFMLEHLYSLLNYFCGKFTGKVADLNYLLMSLDSKPDRKAIPLDVLTSLNSR